MQEQLVLGQDLQHSLDSLCMFFYRPSEDENVVQVDNYYTLCNEILEDIVHHCLKGSWTVGHSKEHYEGLKQATVSIESYLLLIAGLDMYIIKPLLDVKLGKIFGSMKL